MIILPFSLRRETDERLTGQSSFVRRHTRRGGATFLRQKEASIFLNDVRSVCTNFGPTSLSLSDSFAPYFCLMFLFHA